MTRVLLILAFVSSSHGLATAAPGGAKNPPQLQAPKGAAVPGSSVATCSQVGQSGTTRKCVVPAGATSVEIDVSLSRDYPVFVRLPEGVTAAQRANKKFVVTNYQPGAEYVNFEILSGSNPRAGRVTTAVIGTKSLTITLRIRVVSTGGDSQVAIAREAIDPAVRELASQMCEADRRELQAERDRIRRLVERNATGRVLGAAVLGELVTQKLDVNPVSGGRLIVALDEVISFGASKIFVARLKNRRDPLTLGPVTVTRDVGGNSTPLEKRVRCGTLRLGYNDRTRCAVEIPELDSGDEITLVFTDRSGEKTVRVEGVRVP